MKMINQNGMGLIEVMVAGAIGLIVIIGISGLITDVFKSQRTVQSKDASRELITSLRSFLSDSVICTASFGGNNPSGTGFTKTQIIDASSNIKYQTGINYFNNLVTITKMSVSNYIQDNAANPKVGKANFTIAMDKVGATTGGTQLAPITILLQISLDAGSNITQCHALGGSDSLWQISPSNKADIYYQAGNVGIGTSSPTVTLDVAGGIKPGSTGVAIGGSCTTEELWLMSLAHTH